MEQFPQIYLYRRVVQAKLFIDNHFANTLDLDNMAGEASFSKFHFIRLFKNIYGQTPHKYLTKVRMGHAKLMLSEHVSVTDVCFAVGFDSLSSFTALFKKHTGLTPSAFQLQQQQRKSDVAARPLRFIPNCFVENTGWAINSNFQEAV